MLKPHPFKDGRLEGTIYIFENKGDVLDKHTHGEDDKHYCFVTAGVLLLQITGQPDRRLVAGSHAKILPGEEHGLVALTPNARLLNLRY
jgi:quercetin dioxygenase-like cupin family protein